MDNRDIERAKQQAKLLGQDMKLELITPQRARYLLDISVHKQRIIRWHIVDKYAREMATGKWKTSGDTMKVEGERGYEKSLLDGHHRCLAIVKTNTSILQWVCYGVEESVYDVLDQGLKRTFADLLRQRKVSDPVMVATATAGLYRYILYRNFHSGGVITRAASQTDLLELWEDNRELELYCKGAARIYRELKLPGGMTGTMLYVFSVTKTEDPMEFAEQVASGSDLGEGDPAFALRKLLIERMATDATRRMHNDHYYMLFVRAWNAYARGERIVVLRGRVHGVYPEVWDPSRMIEARWPKPKPSS